MEKGCLYLVATPIGNLGDLSYRAVETLGAVDFVAAEDTRVSRKLLNHFEISKPLISYYEHNRRQRGEEIVTRLLAGETCALVTDAGTPAVSDPGEDLVALCAEKGINVIPIPGCCAAICALAVSGLPTGRFTFEGFLSTARRSRQKHLESLKNEHRTMIFYEAPHKLKSTLKDLYEAFGERRLSISRELTKMHEECLRFTLSEAASYFEQNTPRGEFVLIVEGKETQEAQDDEDERLQAALSKVSRLSTQGMTLRDAVKRVSGEEGIKKNALYALALAEQQKDGIATD